jgi:pilus assembly protein Flp/PilA
MFIRELMEKINQWLIGQDEDEESGQGLVEYALIMMLVAVIIVAVMAILGPGIGNIYSGLVATL